MKYLNHNILFAFLALITVFGCKSRKVLQKDSQTNTQFEEKIFWNNQLIFNDIELKASIDVTLNKTDKQSFDLIIRMRKNSIAWISARKFGFEGARILITKDSFFMINRLTKEYVSEHQSKMKDYVSFDANISQLQSLLVGNAIFDKTYYQEKKLDSTYYLEGMKSGLINKLKVLNSKSISNSNLTSYNNPQIVDFKYFNWNKYDGAYLPSLIHTSFKNNTIEHSAVIKYTFVSTKAIANFPFSITDGYKRI